MKRRDFIRTSSLVSASLMVPGFLRGTSNLLGGAAKKGRSLVVIQLSGGNDGLNTIIPYRNDVYYALRPSIGIARAEALRLTDDIGLNPSMMGFKALYDQGLVSVINGVGYPDPNRSHFRSTDIWQSGSAGHEYIQTGWLGRYLDSLENGRAYHGIELDDSLSRALKGEDLKGLAVSDLRQFYQTVKDPFIQELARQSGGHHDVHHHDEVSYLHKTLIDTVESADYLQEKTDAARQASNYPQHPLGKKLRQIADFICAGSDTRVYYLSLGGFDTHVNQAGNHARMLGNYSDALKAFVDDLKKHHRLDDTLVLTFSEFGRRVKQNAGRGTDHGTANAVFLTGAKLEQPGIVGSIPDLEDLEDGDMKHSIDYRRIYAGILNGWFETDPSGIISPGIEALKVIS